MFILICLQNVLFSSQSAHSCVYWTISAAGLDSYLPRSNCLLQTSGWLPGCDNGIQNSYAVHLCRLEYSWGLSPFCLRDTAVIHWEKLAAICSLTNHQLLYVWELYTSLLHRRYCPCFYLNGMFAELVICPLFYLACMTIFAFLVSWYIIPHMIWVWILKKGEMHKNWPRISHSILSNF